jgi:hypothetical protein
MPTSGCWLDPVRACLDRRPQPLTMFVRDDDAGWDDDRLFALLDVIEARALPIDLAAIPMAMTLALGRALAARAAASGGRITVHQHGYSHANHEPTGRKCEFGGSRTFAQQRDDIAEGRRRLADAVGGLERRLFTPPWNRCSAATAEALVELGFDVLSRDRTAAPLNQPKLRELPVHLDWTGRRGAAIGPAAWGRAIADAIAAPAGDTVGLMLHHAVMSADDRQLLGGLLDLVAAHPSVAVKPMLESLGDS